jgi:hypothetical protein
VHNITDTNKLDKMGETARTVSRTGQKSAHTAMDYALGAQEINIEILRRTSQAWIEGFRYQARFSQGMAQVFFGQWGNSFSGTTHADRPPQEQGRSEVTEIAAKDAQQKAEKQRAEKVARETLGQWANAFKSMPPLERPGQEQSGPVGIEPATNGAQKVTEPAAKDVQKDIEKAEKVARETRKAEEAAEETQEATEAAAKSAQKSAEPAAQETQKSTEIAAKDAQKNTETAAFPVEGYDEMNVGEVSERLDGLSEAELKRVGKYEKDNKDRGTLRKEMEQKTETTS